MDIECGMCGDTTEVTKDLMIHLNSGVICVECQKYVLGVSRFPEMPEVVKA